METVGPSALVVAVLYVLSRWALTTLDYAERHPGKGRPALTWSITWWIAIVVSLLGTASVHMWLLETTDPGWRVLVFNAIIFGGFTIGFFVTGHFDHKVRLGLR